MNKRMFIILIVKEAAIITILSHKLIKNVVDSVIVSRDCILAVLLTYA